WMDAVAEAGFPRSKDLNGERAEGVDLIQLSQRGGLRCSSARGYLANRPANLEVMLDAEVLRVDVENGRAAGVTVRRDGQTQALRAAEGVVLSAGALNTPRLL